MSEYGSLQRLEAPRGTDGRRQKAGEGGRALRNGRRTGCMAAVAWPSPAARVPQRGRPLLHAHTRSPAACASALPGCSPSGSARPRVAATGSAAAAGSSISRALPHPCTTLCVQSRALRCHVHCATRTPQPRPGVCRPPRSCGRVCASRPSWHGVAHIFYRRSPYIDVPLI